MALLRATIDGRDVEVEPGTTILEAARGLGIEIPTLCHVAGHEPAASCFLCAVQVAGRRVLSPACAMPVEDGMEITTRSQDVRQARKMALELLLSDHAGDCVAPCAVRCPAGLEIPAFVREIAAGEPAAAMPVLLETLTLPGTLGRICPRLCETACRRCSRDEGLAIGALHRYAADRYAETDNATALKPPPAPPSGKSVAIVGAGPAGLAAALGLLRRGHAATLYDAHGEPGGMLRWAIPAYRLPRAVLAAEVEAVRALGARFCFGARWGRDFDLAALRREHDAVFLAIGAQRSRRLDCPGDELALAGLELLARVAAGEHPELGARVAVIGGGNTAMDAARTARRLGAEVAVFYRRSPAEMPCLLEEVEAAEDEGVELEMLCAPTRLERRSDSRVALTLVRMELGEPDASGRRGAHPITGSEREEVFDTVIAAVGQAVERELAESEGLATTAWGIAADPHTLATNLEGVFAGGDAVLGADLAVRAVGAGRRAAVAIDQWLRGAEVTGPEELVSVALTPLDDDERAALFRAVEARLRVPTPHLAPDVRVGSFAEIDAGLGDAEALRESRRCLSCGCSAAGGCGLRRLATEYGADPKRFLGARRRFERDDSHPEIVYEPGKCILCGACVAVAEAAAADRHDGRPGIALVGRGFKTVMAAPFGTSLAEALGPETARRCAEVCPTGAIALRTARACDFVRLGRGG